MPEIDVACSKLAFEHYAAGNFEKARSVLDGLKNENVKVKHNVLLARYFQHCLSADELLIELSQLLKPHASSETANAHSKHHDDLHVLRYNTALLMVQLQHYLSAVTLLEEGFARIEPIDDFLAIKISFLLIEAYLRLKEPYRAMDVISYLEKPNSFITVLGKKEFSSPLSEPTLAVGEDDAQDLDIGDDETFQEVYQVEEEQTVFIDLPKTPECKDGWIPSIGVAAFLTEHGRAPDTLSLVEYKFNLYIYRARTQLQILANFPDDELAPGNSIYADVQNAYKLIGEIRKSRVLDCPQWQELKDAVSRQQIATCRCLMAQTEYLANSEVPREARCLHFLSTCRFNFVGNDDIETEDKEFPEDDFEESSGCHPASDERTAGLFYNNLALLHLKMRKPALASVYFQKSLQFHTTRQPSLLPSERAWCQSASREVRYNLGVTLLMLKHPFQAFRELKPLANATRWPKLWLRIADCCMEMRKEFDRRSAASPEAGTPKPAVKRIIKSIQGRGKARRFLLVSDRDTGLPPRAEPSFDMMEPKTSGECLQSADIALKKALLELEELKAGYQFDELHDERFKGLHWLRIRTAEDAVLAKLSYCLLCQKDYAQALFYAREILVNHGALPPEETLSGENSNGAPSAPKKNSSGSISAPVIENGKKDATGSAWSVIPPERGAVAKGAAKASSTADVKAVGVLRLGVMYAAECLMALNKVHDAKLLLSGVLNGHFFPRGASKTHIVECKYLVDLTRKLKPPHASRKPPCTIEQLVTSGYGVSPWSVLPMQAELPDTIGDQKLFWKEEVTTLIEAQAELYANLACLHAASGDADTSEHMSAVASYIDVASAMNPTSVAARRTRVYLKLRAKKSADAMQILRG